MTQEEQDIYNIWQLILSGDESNFDLAIQMCEAIEYDFLNSPIMLWYKEAFKDIDGAVCLGVHNNILEQLKLNVKQFYYMKNVTKSVYIYDNIDLSCWGFMMFLFKTFLNNIPNIECFHSSERHPELNSIVASFADIFCSGLGWYEVEKKPIKVGDSISYLFKPV